MHSSTFHSTRWTLVRRAQGDGTEARAALSELCEIYYQPVLLFTRSWCGDADRAQDLAHGFFEDLLGRESIGAADPVRGRFRTYLLGSVKHFLCRQRERDAAAKRGGDFTRVPLEDSHESHDDWELEFDKAWALALIRRALDSLGDEMEESGKAEQFEILRPWLDGGAAGDVSETGIALDLSPTALKVAIHRLRQRFRQKIREEITATTADPEDAAAEFRHLVDVWVRVENTPNKPPV
jgi:DNA-directed RNA polymerase specialized sigma24 family protein